jgi:serine protease
VAGSVGATLYGIAKGVTLVSVKVLGDNGSGSFAGVIAGIDWSAGDSDGADTSNMSLGGGLSTAVNDAVNAAVLNGA